MKTSIAFRKHAHTDCATMETLYRWHYLVSGDRNDVHRFGISVRHRTISEREVDTEQLDNFVIEGV